MKSIGGVVLAIVILLVMVTIHEFGHYIAGKLLHFKIEEFSVGFGPAIFKKRSKKTGELFALRVIPLGGYCAFDGEDDTDDADSPTPPPAEPFEDMSSKSVSERSESPSPASDGRFADASAPPRSIGFRGFFFRPFRDGRFPLFGCGFGSRIGRACYIRGFPAFGKFAFGFRSLFRGFPVCPSPRKRGSRLSLLRGQKV